MRVKIYSSEVCPYCTMAKNWFSKNGIEYEEILVNTKEAIESYISECPGCRTVPQILIGGVLQPGGWNGLQENEEKIRSILLG